MTQTLYLENILNRKKNIQLKNLHTLDVLVTDKNPTSRYFKITKDDGSQILQIKSPIDFLGL